MSAVLPMAGAGALTIGLLMFTLWLVQVRTRNAGYVDIGWAYSLGVLAVLYAALGPAVGMQKWALAAMVAVWSLRLGTHLLLRIVGKPEEGRYQQLRAQWKTGLNWKFLIFFELQAVLDVLLSIPFLLVAADTSTAGTLGAPQVAGIVLWMVAVAGESVADAQLARFKRTSAHGVCRIGLWKFSRHPNYFFEWLVWIAWAIFATSSLHGWLGFGSPVLMLFFLYRVTGIPATEAQSVRSKGDAYREYQRTTSAFVPWFPKQSSERKLAQ